jgi:hypothetical protein
MKVKARVKLFWLDHPQNALEGTYHFLFHYFQFEKQQEP